MSDATAEHAYALTGVPRGLPNIAASCYINAALQIVATSPRLRAQTLRKRESDHPLHRFFAAYDDADQGTLVQRHDDVVRYIRTLRPVDFMASALGSSAEVLQALGIDPTQIMGELDELHRKIVQDDDHEFDVGSTANTKNMSYDALRAVGDLNGFLYFTGNHYIAYVRNGQHWYLADDQRVRMVSAADMRALPVHTGVDEHGHLLEQACVGIVFASYSGSLP